MAKNPGDKYEQGGIAFVGCILLGLGVGWAVDTEFMVQGAIIGTGLGFVVMALLGSKRG